MVTVSSEKACCTDVWLPQSIFPPLLRLQASHPTYFLLGFSAALAPKFTPRGPEAGTQFGLLLSISCRLGFRIQFLAKGIGRQTRASKPCCPHPDFCASEVRSPPSGVAWLLEWWGLPRRSSRIQMNLSILLAVPASVAW